MKKGTTPYTIHVIPPYMPRVKIKKYTQSKMIPNSVMIPSMYQESRMIHKKTC